MCMFCVAIPATAVPGAKLNADRQAEMRGTCERGTQEFQTWSIEATSAGLIVLLANGPIRQHTPFDSFTQGLQ